MIKIQTLIEENNNYSQAVKDTFIKFWNMLQDDKRRELEQSLEEKPELVNKMLEVINMKTQAINDKNSSKIDEIIKLEENILNNLEQE